MATHSSILAWKIPWMEEPGRLQSMGSLELEMTERLHFHAVQGTLKSLLQHHSSKASTLWVKAQHEGALPPPCIVRKDPRVPHTAGRGA